ncbi:hypothetical protein AB1L42_04570 [Thalassoglobus sp. JC818]|uniref:hypothetical protein n=1 Tax=Thalassoglobus sp. JC818 TaxID=3232136 RepID=UPI0034580C7D
MPFSLFLLPDDRVIPPTYYSDYTTAQLPLREYARDEMLAGRFPLWIPELACGTPLHANMQAGLSDPLVTPSILLFNVSYGLRLSIVVHAAFGFFGQYLLTRSLGTSRFASSFSALVMTLSGFPIAHLMVGHITMFVAWTRIPWLLLSVVFLTRQPGPLFAGLTAVAGGLVLLSGHPQIACYAGLLGAAWGAGSMFWGSASAHRTKFLWWAILAVILSTTLSAVQYVPAMELIRDGMTASDRGNSSYADHFSLQPSDLVRLLIPNFKGNPFDDASSFDFFELYHEEYQYLGILTLLLGGIALTRKSVLAWEAVTGTAVLLLLLYSLGRNSHLFTISNQLFPPLTLFRCPGRILCLASILVPILAARGLDDWIQRERTSNREVDRTEKRIASKRAQLTPWKLSGWTMLFFAVNLLAWLILNDVESGFGDEILAWWNRSDVCRDAVIKSSGLAVASVWVLMQLRSVQKNASTTIRLRWQVLFLVFVTIDLWLFNASQLCLVPREKRVDTSEQQTTAARSFRFLDRSLDTDDTLLQLRYSRLLPVAVLNRFPMVGTNEGGIFPRHVQRVHEAIQQCPEKALDLVSCRYICTHDGQWMERESAVPRIRFLPERHRHLAEDSLCESNPLDWQQRSDFSYEIVSDHSRGLTVEVDLPEAGIVGVADTRFPGWQCFVNGQLIEIEALHEVFRLCPLPAGKHRLTFFYNPQSLYWGVAITVLSGFMTTGLLVVGLRCQFYNDARIDIPSPAHLSESVK